LSEQRARRGRLSVKGTKCRDWVPKKETRSKVQRSQDWGEKRRQVGAVKPTNRGEKSRGWGKKAQTHVNKER